MDGLDIYLAAAPIGIAAIAAVGLLAWNPGKKGRAARRAGLAVPAQPAESAKVNARLDENEHVIQELRSEISRLRGSLETLTATSMVQSYSFSPSRTHEVYGDFSGSSPRVVVTPAPYRDLQR